MNEAIVKLGGFGPAGLIPRLYEVRWLQMTDDEHGRSFRGIALAGRNLVRDGGSENMPLRISIVDNSTKEEFQISGRTFKNVRHELFRCSHIAIMDQSLQEEHREGLVLYTVQIFHCPWMP